MSDKPIELVPIVDAAGEKVYVPATPDLVTPPSVQHKPTPGERPEWSQLYSPRFNFRSLHLSSDDVQASVAEVNSVMERWRRDNLDFRREWIQREKPADGK